MFRAVSACFWTALLLLALTQTSPAQSIYQVVTVSNGGTIIGTVKWSGTTPRPLTFPVTKDPAVCDPDSHKRVDLERLIIGPDGGVANTVVFLKNISSGKAMDIPQARRFLNQKQCRYEPHILLVPQAGNLEMKSSDTVLHTVHMDGAASFNLPFPFTNQVVTRPMNTPGLVTLKCNGGHVWMNAEVFVVSHPYYAVTAEDGKFKLADVPPGQYEIVAWHEGWNSIRHEGTFDVLTEKRVDRPLFTDPRTWEKNVSVLSNSVAVVDFTLREK
jgi:hypothetical protein